MKRIVLDFPDNFEIDSHEALMAIATKLYEKGKLSLGQAAELVGLSKKSFLEIVGSYGVNALNYTPEELENDVKNAKGNHR